MIPLLRTKTADTAHTGMFCKWTRPFPIFWTGPGDEATMEHFHHVITIPYIKNTILLCTDLSYEKILWVP